MDDVRGTEQKHGEGHGEFVRSIFLFTPGHFVAAPVVDARIYEFLSAGENVVQWQTQEQECCKKDLQCKHNLCHFFRNRSGNCLHPSIAITTDFDALYKTNFKYQEPITYYLHKRLALLSFSRVSLHGHRSEIEQVIHIGRVADVEI